MKNVLLLVIGGEQWAVELRWVREIFSLVALTPVPTAPPAVAGVVNFKGAIVPVLHATEILHHGAGRTLRPGDALVLLDVEGVRAALAAERIDSVTTLSSGDGGAVTAEGGPVPLLDPPTLVAAVQRMTAA